MNTLHFRYAVEIEKTRSITQAAENLYMAQPNLSKAIKELESSLSITIFRRTSKGVIPTEQGVKFLDCAKKVLMQIDNMEAISSPDKHEKYNIRISVPRTGYISEAFSDYIADSDIPKNMDISFSETNSLSTIENVRENGCNFGIIRFNKAHEKYFIDFLKEKNLEWQSLWEYEMLAVMSAEHPAADKSNLAYSEFSADYIEIIQGDNLVPYIAGATEKLFDENRQKNASARHIYTCDRGSALNFLINIPKSFMLDSPMPKSICGRYGLVQKKCSFPDNCFNDYIIYTAGRKFSGNELDFINKLYEVRNKLAFE